MRPDDIISAQDIPSDELFHFAMAVPDLQAAMDQLGPALNVNWTSVWSMTRKMDTPEGPTTDEMQAVYSRQGPPYVELVSGYGSGFFAADNGPRLHHVGYIVDDVRAEAERLQALGMTIWDLGPGSAFVTNEVGMTFEIMGTGIRDTLDEWFNRPAD
ncbi:MAG: VOC family protein [Chloroflexota bacterium]|nr:VOC family protein [Chloroflexota bacterium]